MKVVDLHCDTISVLYRDNKNGGHQSLWQNNLQIDVQKLLKGDYALQCFAMFVPLKMVENPFEQCLSLIDCYYQELDKNKEYIKHVNTYDDIIDNMKEGRMSSLLTIEEGGVCKGNLEYLRIFHRLGVRLITLTWNFENGIGFPNFKMNRENHQIYDYPNTKDGLTPFGIEMIKEMNKLGIIIDVSHLSDAGFYDVAKYSTKPFVASHSNARSKCWFPRNLTDDMIRVIADKRGVIGINFCKDFLVENEDEDMIESLIKHINHIRKIGGIDCLALGTDFDGIERTDKIDNAGDMQLLADALYKEGYTQEEVEKIFYKNALRVFKECL